MAVTLLAAIQGRVFPCPPPEVDTAFVFDYMLAALAGVAVVVSIPIVGILLISALLVLPALTSMQVARSFKQTFLLSPLFGSISVIMGLLFSIIEPHAAPGGTIVLVGVAILLTAMIVKRIRLHFE